MLRMVARLSARARAMPARSPLTSVTPALCIATSVPVPIASADVGLRKCGRIVDAVAGPRHRVPFATQAPHDCVFCSCRTSASMSVMPSLLATACAVVRLSPVSITMRTPSARRLASAAGVVALIGSATAMIPAGWPLTATNIAVAPSRRASSACRSRAPVATPRSCRSLALPTATLRPPIVPVTPLPVIEVEFGRDLVSRAVYGDQE